MPAREERRGRATLHAFLAASVWMFFYEAVKQALLPGLSPWQSHGITIAVSACSAAFVTYIAIVQQSTTLKALAEERAHRERLEMVQSSHAVSEARYRRLIEASSEAIVVHRDGVILHANAAAAAMVGVTEASELIGVPISELVSVGNAAWSSSRHAATTQEYPLHRLDGARIDVEFASVEIPYELAPAVQTVLRDVTERRRLEARLVHDAMHDPLTGLPNRTLFRDRVDHALARLVRTSSAAGVTVLFLDLDNFKTVNDTLGHVAGDRMLVAVSDRLRNATRSYDTVARLGGDEFAILLEELLGDSEALSAVERIREALRVPVRLDGRDIVITASIGVAHALPTDAADDLLRNADVAMYEAKEAGKSRHAVFEPSMYEAIVERLALEGDLRDASVDPAAAGFALVYQPIVELGSGAVRGMEALLRWSHPTRGRLTPDMFIPLAEQTGAIVHLGGWVLRTACAQLETWRRNWIEHGLPADTLPSVTVNISGRQLLEAGFVDEVADAIRLTLAAPRRITLEITETVIMQDTERTLSMLTRLQALGVRLAIDDFGTGYSSLSYLQKFPVDILKIDRAFVDGVARGDAEAALARTIIALGHTLGLRTVAEGVEDVAQRDQLRRLGCQLGQGYLFARPMLPADATEWILARQPRVGMVRGAA